MKRRLFIGLGVFLLSLLAVLAWLAGTAPGLRFLLAQLLPRVPVEIHYESAGGRLVGPLVLEGLVVDTPAARVEVERIELQWRALGLLEPRIHVDYLDVTRPRADLKPAPAPAEEPPPAGEPFRLPLPVRVDRLELVEGRVTRDGEPVLAELSLGLAGHAHEQSLALTRLHVESDRVQVDGHASLSLARESAWDVDLEWTVRTGQAAALSGHTRIEGRLDAMAVRQTLAGLVEGRIEGTVTGLPAAPAWDLALALQPLSAEGPWPAILAAASAGLTVTGDLAESAVAGELRVPELARGPVAVDGRGGWRDGEARLESVELGFVDGGSVRLVGTLAPGEGLALDARLSAEDMTWPPAAEAPMVRLPALELAAQGDESAYELDLVGRVAREGLPETRIEADARWADRELDVSRIALAAPDAGFRAQGTAGLSLAGEEPRYHARLQTTLANPDYPEASGVVEAAGDAGHLELRSLDLEALGGRITGGGTLAWTDETRMDFELALAGIDPGVLLPDWRGSLSAALRVQGRLGTEEGLSLELTGLDGQLRDRPVDGVVSARLLPDALLLRRAELSLGRAAVSARGRIGEVMGLEFQADVPDLADVLPDTAGELTASGSVRGPRSEPALMLDASARSLRLGGAVIGSAEVEGGFDVSGRERSEIEARVDDFDLAGGETSDFTLSVAGRPSDHGVRLTAERQGRRLDAALAGALALDERSWDGRVTDLRFSEGDRALWTLRAPAPLHAGTERVALEDLCMDGTLGLLCTSGRWRRGQAFGGQLVLGRLDLEPLTRWLGQGLIASGVLAGQVVVEAEPDAFVSLGGGLGLTEGAVTVEGEEAPLLRWTSGSVSLDGDRDAARVGLGLDLAGADRVDGRLEVAWNEPDPALDGRLEARVDELEIITELVPDVSGLQGWLEAELRLSGTVAVPVLQARAAWLDGAATLPALGIRPKGIRVEATVEDNRLRFEAGARSGEGQLTATGDFDLAAEGVVGQARLTGDSVLVVDLPEARLLASPDIEFDYRPGILRVTGDLRIPSGSITGIVKGGGESVSPDQVIVAADGTPAETPGLEVHARVTVTVGPDVSLEVVGLTGKIAGELVAISRPGRLPSGRGEVRVEEGEFEAFGQQLDIEAGRLVYTGGPLEDPGLDIRATRTVQEVVAGVQVRGTLTYPEITVFSDPPMPRAEALSYLTLGKGLDDLNSGEQASLNQAANALALSGGGLLARSVGEKVGLDEVGVQGNDDGGSSVVVGKYLGSGLFVSYGLGLFEAVNTLRIRYQISQRLSLEATSGEEAAADIYYTFERD